MLEFDGISGRKRAIIVMYEAFTYPWTLVLASPNTSDEEPRDIVT